MVAVRAAIRLGNDFIDDIEFHQILPSQFERFGRFGGVASIFPQNSGAGLGTDDRIVGVLQDHDVIGHPDAESTARAAFADDSRKNGHAQIHHFTEIDCDRFGNVAFFRTVECISRNFWRGAEEQAV